MTRWGLRFALLVGLLVALAAPAQGLAAYTLTVTTTEGGRVTGSAPLSDDTIDCGPNSSGDCSGTYPPIAGTVDRTVSLTATPLPGWRFVSWTGCSSTNGTQCSRLMGPSNADRTVSATFANDPPSVAFTDPTPTEFSTVSGDVPVAATATDDSGVAEVRFYARFISGAATFLLLIDTDTNAPYEALWHTRILDNGFHGIVVRAEDAAGEQSQEARDLTITNPNGVRYAAPGANGPDPCLQTNPCELVHAVRHAVSGDEVVVLPGDYALPNGLFVNRQVDIHGVSGQPRPRLISAGNFGVYNLDAPATLRHLQVEASEDAALGVGAGTFGTPVFSDLMIIVTGSEARAVSIDRGNAIVRDSVAHATGDFSVAVRAVGANEVDLRNVTAWATGANSIAIESRPEFEGSPVITARNVVARGGRYDLSATTSTNPAAINVSHSNYRPTAIGQSPGGTVNDQGNNQSAEPLFADAAVGDFHQLPGSPTIDAGVGDDKLGPTDFDGQARTMGTAPDIGADEFVPVAAPPSGSGSGNCTIVGTDGNDRITGTRGNDVICAGKGNDVVNGGGGNDVILLGAGNDKGYGGAGKDRIVGGKGKDRLFGGGGNDRLLAKDRVKKEIVDGGAGKKDVCKLDRGDIKRRCP